MSLLTTASVWESPDEKPKSSNRTRRKPSQAEKNIAKTIEENDTKSNKISQLLNNMGSVLAESDGKNLESFTPPPLPKLSNTRDGYISPFQKDGKDKEQQDFQNVEGFQDGILSKKPISNYQDSYSNKLTNIGPILHSTKQHLGQYMGSGPSNLSNDKVLEKLNYMIQLLEEQQHEQTQNVTEEFLLYTFLGVFIIYIVDSFTKSGKYIR